MAPKPKVKRSRKPTNAAKVWKSLSDRFAALADVESRQGGEYCPLLLACFYPDMEAANPVGLFDKGKWELYDGLNFQTEYRRIAIDAGRAMGAERTIRFEVWAHRLGWYVTTEKLPYEFNGRNIQIHNLCQVSAAFCKWLKDQSQAPPASFLNPKRPRIGERITATYPGAPIQGVPPERAPSRSRAQEQSDQQHEPAATADPFTHSQDYRSVTVRGETFTLTTRQAQMIQILHEEHEAGKPDVAIDAILLKLTGDSRSESSRWHDSFKSNPSAKKALIKTGARKGTLRLNL